METFSPPVDLSTHAYYQLVHTLTSLLPPPIDDSPEALRTRNHAAIAKVAALLPVNANEADLAAQCIAARAQAEEMLRLIRQQAGFTELVIRLNAQYGSMVRASLAVHGRLMRVQALRQKRQAIGSAVNEDAWALHVAERSMLEVVDPPARRREAASPEGARAASPEGARAASPEGARAASPEGARAVSPTVALVATPVEAPAASVDQTVADHISDNETDSHDTAFETGLSAQVRNPTGSAETGLRAVVREAMAEPREASSPEPARTVSPEPARTVSPEPERAVSPKAAPVATQIDAPAASVDPTVADHVSENETDSHDAAFETWLSAQPWNATGSAETALYKVVREAMAGSRLANSPSASARSRGRESPANGRKTPGRAA